MADKSNRIDNASDNSINAFSQLVDEIERYVILQGNAYTITKLLDMIKTFDPLIPDNYKPSNLQRPLEKQFGKRITILSQHGQGKSNFLFSRSITLVDAIKTVKNKANTKKKVYNFHCKMYGLTR